MTDRSRADDDTGTPRWVKISGAIAAALVALVVIAIFTGHGPGRHFAGHATAAMGDMPVEPPPPKAAP